MFSIANTQVLQELIIILFKIMMADSVTQTLNVNVSAPGKVILFGEHSVVYGKTAIAAALKHRTTAQITEHGSTENLIELNFLSINLHQLYKITPMLEMLHSGPNNFILGSKLEFSLNTPEKLNHSSVLEFVNKFITEIDREFNYSNAQLKATQSFFVLLIGMLLSVNIKINHMVVKVSSQLPIGAGCGSSASFGVSLAGALLSFIKCKSKNENISRPDFQQFMLPNDNQDELVSRWAFLGEIIQHGRPSGIDNMVCTKGSIIQFCKGEDGKSFSVNKLTQLLNLRILLVDTRVQRNTGDLAASVLNKKKRHPQLMESILDAMDILAREAAKLISEMSEKEDCEKFSNLEELVDLNQSLLCALGVSHPFLDKIVSVASTSELHAKLTGAGGGGCAFVLLPHTLNDIKLNVLKEQLSILGFSHIEALLGGPGIIYHE